VIDILRGNKRKILEVVVKADSKNDYEKFTISSANDLSREEIVDGMLKAGVWPFVRQKPYDIIANPMDIPKAIFISSFNSCPLSIDNDFALYGMNEIFQKGLDYIVKLTKGKTHVNIDVSTSASKVFSAANGVQINNISGPHPSGNVGVQIHHIDPINKGDIVWYLEPQDVLAIARLFTEGKYDVSRIVALSGSQVSRPRYHRTIIGAPVINLLFDNLKDGENRIISGDVLTGTKINIDGNLGFYDTSMTVIEEGKEQEFFGWILPGLHKFSASRTFFSWLNSGKKYDVNSNMHGEERAYVVTGEYEKVLPMDILPLQLIKAIMIEDIELMENLGIYEVSPEDFALCEFVCTSKMDVQSIIRHGLDLVRQENS
jgi:Na+-transporting NADH:ubiquinone oxidoreductase subunit A